MLLSRGAVIISEHSYGQDEAEYAGLIHFGTVAELPSLLSRALRASNTTDSPGRASLQIRDSIAREYAVRFDPQRIFERAGIYDDLLLALPRSMPSSLPQQPQQHNAPLPCCLATPNAIWKPTTLDFGASSGGQSSTRGVSRVRNRWGTSNAGRDKVVARRAGASRERTHRLEDGIP